MKANEIPEKIYLSYEPDDEDNKDHIFINYMWHNHPFDGKNLKNVEYVRKDVFIEKIANYLNYMLYDRVEITKPGTIISSLCTKGEFIEDFKNYIEGK